MELLQQFIGVTDRNRLLEPNSFSMAKLTPIRETIWAPGVFHHFCV
jgi:hypothetical protein